MDWINEQAEIIWHKVKNMPLRESLLVYLLLGVLICALCTWTTEMLCGRQVELIYAKHDIVIERMDGQQYYAMLVPSEMSADLSENDFARLKILGIIEGVAPYVYMSLFTAVMGICFYYKRIKRPSEILAEGTREIQNNNLDFAMEYDSKDEMGKLCISFEEMRRELADNKEKMWSLVEEQKKINAAFAHDLRTPLTVLKGYSDFLYRYIPERKVSEEKLLSTLKLMSEHIARLERYSYTMKDIRNFDELKVKREEVSLCRLIRRVKETADALNQIGEIQITVQGETDTDQMIWIDENVVFEVVENLLSNAIRYAKSKVEIVIGAEKDEEMLYIYVKDDGEGFSGEELKRAKAPYFYNDKKKAEGEHFGIGLHIVSVLCNKCGGTLDIANSINGGAFASVSFSYRDS